MFRILYLMLLLPIATSAQTVSQSDLAARIAELSFTVRPATLQSATEGQCRSNNYTEYQIKVDDCFVTLFRRSKDEVDSEVWRYGAITTHLSALTIRDDKTTGYPYEFVDSDTCGSVLTGKTGKITFVTGVDEGVTLLSSKLVSSAATPELVDLRKGTWEIRASDFEVVVHGLPNIEDEARLQELTTAIRDYKTLFCQLIS